MKYFFYITNRNNIKDKKDTNLKIYNDKLYKFI